MDWYGVNIICDSFDLMKIEFQISTLFFIEQLFKISLQWSRRKMENDNSSLESGVYIRKLKQYFSTHTP